MRINHKSDFDFRLDLYAADPYGTAVATGFPDCDFTGKLFIGPSARSRQCYIFSKQGKTLVNCFDSDGLLHVVVSGHNLSTGPLYCELSLRVPDSHYPGGFRTVVYSFPLNLYLTDNDAEIISPTVSVTLPVMKKTEDAVPMQPDVSKSLGRLDVPWQNQKICAGPFCTGAFAGNIYPNNAGKIFLSVSNPKNINDLVRLDVYIPPLLKLGIDGLTSENLVSYVIAENTKLNYYATVVGDFLHIYIQERGISRFYLTIPKSEYAYINKEGKIVRLDYSPIPEYKPRPFNADEIVGLIKSDCEDIEKIILIERNKNKSFVIERFYLQKRIKVYRQDLHNFFVWRKPKHYQWKWIRKEKIRERIYSRNLFLRIARKKRGRFSDWTYFKIVSLHDPHYNVGLFITDEEGHNKKFIPILT